MIKIKAPGRICLFGEHQDYLGLPVIAMAISKYIYLRAAKNTRSKFIIDFPDIGDFLEIPLNNQELEYSSKRDYIKSGYNQFIRKGFKFNKGYNITISGDIPINAGASSSSALVISWLYFLNLLCGFPLTKYELALEGYNTEVREFGESGGKMDFFTSVFGKMIYLEPTESHPKLIEIPLKLKGLVLGNSKEKKETVEDLRKTKSLSIESFTALKDLFPGFNIHVSTLKDLEDALPKLALNYQEKILGNIINRDLTSNALKLIQNHDNRKEARHLNMKRDTYFYKTLGNLLNRHQYQLKNNIKVSTKKIDTIIKACLDSGALGAKINGSGFGGTMFALAPHKKTIMKKVMETCGGEAFKISTSRGVHKYK